MGTLFRLRHMEPCGRLSIKTSVDDESFSFTIHCRWVPDSVGATGRYRRTCESGAWTISIAGAISRAGAATTDRSASGSVTGDRSTRTRHRRAVLEVDGVGRDSLANLPCAALTR